MRVLAVDDDPVVLKIVTVGLKALGHKVVACENGAQAWDAFKQSEFHVVVTDWDMPYLDGLELTEAVRKARRESYTYVIMLTGMSKREHYLQGLKAGADAFLVKPLDGALLEAQMVIAERILGLQEHTKQLEAIITVCSHCKRVKDGITWVSMEDYMLRRFKTKPSHGYCPDCFESKVGPELRNLGISTEGILGL
jgi:sigma-B regulation protein RsbU (phosphoserine phosphatase)